MSGITARAGVSKILVIEPWARRHIQHTFYHVKGKAWRLKMHFLPPLPSPPGLPPKRSCAQMQSVFCSAYLQPANIARAPIIMWRILSGMDNAFLLVGLQGWPLATIVFCKQIYSDGFETLVQYRKTANFITVSNSPVWQTTMILRSTDSFKKITSPAEVVWKSNSFKNICNKNNRNNSMNSRNFIYRVAAIKPEFFSSFF